MIDVQLEPVDTWFFRDGTPFAKGSAPQDNVEGLFPPYPTTVAGALRAALAREKGWNGRGRWSLELNTVLGDGPKDVGALSFDGPFLLKDGEMLFRVPRHLFGSRDENGWTPSAFLRPGPPVACDLGDAVRLPEPAAATGDFAELKADDGEWLTVAGMNSVLRGWLPKPGDVVSNRSLWSAEERIGLERDEDSRSAKEGMLYSTRHVRLHRGVSLGARIGGLPPSWTPPFGRLVPLGGEGRVAECRKWDAQEKLDMPMARIKSSGKVAVVALSPLDIDHAVIRGERPLAGLGDARAISACLNRPQRIGSWDSLAHRPLPLRSVLPPGSVLFCEIPERARDTMLANGGMTRLGKRPEWGFGLVALGVWPDDWETLT